VRTPRSTPQRGRAIALAALLAALPSPAHPARRDDAPKPLVVEDFYRPFPSEALGTVAAGEVPGRIEVLPPRGVGSWPDDLRHGLARRIRDEWGGGVQYGVVHGGVALWLAHPLVTASLGDRVLVPVLPDASLALRGTLALPDDERPRRVVLLLDASSSANAPVLFKEPDGRVERLSVLEAERRAIERLIDALDPARVELGVIAFGETTMPLVPPGASADDMRAALDRFRRERPQGEGRTDTVCALRLAREWLESTPGGADREIVMLTDGDTPYSGRFRDCDYARRAGRGAREKCEVERNQSACPAEHSFRESDGTSDVVQLVSFARAVRGELAVHPLLFEPDRPGRVYRDLALRTGGRVSRVPSPEAIEAALPALVARRIRGVFAHNRTTGATSGDLYLGVEGRFEGSLPLVPGANDVELRVEGDRGTAGLLRFRIYSEPGLLERYLAELRDRNRKLELRVEDLVRSGREAALAAPPAAAPERRLALEPEKAPPAAPDDGGGALR
jgi:hypothetical protein